MAKTTTLYQPYFANRRIRRELFKSAQADFRPAIEARAASILRDRKVAYENSLTVKQMREKAEAAVALTPEQEENIVMAGMRPKSVNLNFTESAS